MLTGIYSASYLSASWAYIGETDEMQVWNYGQPPVAAFASSTGSLGAQIHSFFKFRSVSSNRETQFLVDPDANFHHSNYFFSGLSTWISCQYETIFTDFSYLVRIFQRIFHLVTCQDHLSTFRRLNGLFLRWGGAKKTDGVEDTSTASEKEFRRKYTAITHRMVHRKSSMEMFKRLATSTFGKCVAWKAQSPMPHVISNA